MIEVFELAKRYGRRAAVDGVSFTVRPGRITGFLGPNGAGKSTTMRMILGLCTPDAGWARVRGVDYRRLRTPLRTVGALLDPGDALDGRSARAHLAALAASNSIPSSRVQEVVRLVDLDDAADRRVGGYSLGMRQRLGIAAALLGGPSILLLDEPMNGLDTAGVRWLRGLLRDRAANGCAVLLSSHQMSEMEQIADHLIVIQAGRLVADEPLATFTGRLSAGAVRVRTQASQRLAAALTAAGGAVVGAEAAVGEATAGDALSVTGLSAADVGLVAAREGVALIELTQSGPTLEDAFTEVIEASA